MKNSTSFLLAGILALVGFPAFATADIEIPEHFIGATHAGVEIIDAASSDFDPLMPTIIGKDLNAVNGIWDIHIVNDSFPFVPAERGIYALFRGGRGELDGGAALIGVNFSFVKDVIQTSPLGTTTKTVTFNLPFLGDLGTPSGMYTLMVAELPETKFVYDPDIDDFVEMPYEDSDFAEWFADSTFSSDFHPPLGFVSMEFDYIAGGTPTENTAALCSDEADNDGDSLVDLLDDDCENFIPKLTVFKVVVNDEDGTKAAEDFVLFLDDGNSNIPVTGGVVVELNPGSYSVHELEDANYLAAYSGDCDSSGQLVLAIGDNKTCTITNDDIASSEPQVPTISGLGQFRQFGVDAVAEGDVFVGNAAVFKGTVADADSSQVRMEVEVKPVGVAFDAIGTYVTPLTDVGEISIPVDGLIEPPEQTPVDGYENAFHWRARAFDEQEETSEWQEFGTAGNTDFVARYTLGLAASDLAQQLVNQPGASDAYELGARGWDYNLGQFASAARVAFGYDYRSGLTGEIVLDSPGIDCSGLIYWAFNKSVDPHTADGNYVANITADGMFRDKQSDLVLESELQPGDTLSFDWDTNGRVDHVAMYVGASGGYDIVNASSEAVGIVRASKSLLSSLTDFEGYRHIRQNSFARIESGSPVDLIVTDPDGNTLSYNSVTPSDEEFIREVPGELYYSEVRKGHDGNPVDVVYLATLKEGTYNIVVAPNLGASPEETYSVQLIAGDQTVTLAQNVQLSEIPQNGYRVEVGPAEEISIVKEIVATLDTYVKGGTPNKNQGAENILRVRAAGDNRALVKFDLSDIPQNAAISSAKLVLNISNNKDNWGANGRTIGSYTIIKGWTELGATWNCGIDSNTTNSSGFDCNGTNWEMGKSLHPQLWPYKSAPTATTTIANGQLGEIEFDVTLDVQAFISGMAANHGWLIRKEKEGLTGHVEFSSRETANSPKLIVTY